MRDSISSLELENDMNGDLRKRIRRLSSRMSVLSAAILLVLPASISMLCIAPGIHVAIEELNAPCSAHSAVSACGVRLPGNDLDMTGSSGNCTDILVLANERGAIPKFIGSASDGSPATECFGDSLPESAQPRVIRQSLFNDVDALPPVFPSVPLRC